MHDSHSFTYYDYRNVHDITECINGYKHILAYESNFKAAFEQIKDDTPALEELVRVVRPIPISHAYTQLTAVFR